MLTYQMSFRLRGDPSYAPMFEKTDGQILVLQINLSFYFFPSWYYLLTNGAAGFDKLKVDSVS